LTWKNDTIHLLDVVLPDVTDIEGPGGGVERHAEGIAESERVDLRHRSWRLDEGIVRRNSVLSVRGVRSIHVDAEDLAVRRVELLGVAVPLMPHDGRGDRGQRAGGDEEVLPVGVVGPAAIAHRDVEQAIGSEHEVAAIVVELRPVHSHELASTGQVDPGGRVTGTQGGPLGHHVLMVGRAAGRDRRQKRRRTGVGLRRIRVELAVRRVVRVEGEAEESPLVERIRPEHAKRDEPGTDVEEQRLRPRGEIHGPGPPDLVNYIEPVRLSRRDNAFERRHQSVREELEADRKAARLYRCKGRRQIRCPDRAGTMRMRRHGDGEHGQKSEHQRSGDHALHHLQLLLAVPFRPHNFLVLPSSSPPPVVRMKQARMCEHGAWGGSRCRDIREESWAGPGSAARGKD
jgi:hypothetical protein